MAGGSGTGGIEIRVGEDTVRDITPLVRRFLWTESMIAGGFSWEMDFSTEDWPEFTGIMLGRDSPTIRFRLKSQDGPYEATTEWRTAITDGSTAGFRGEALSGRVRGADRRLVLRQKARTRAWPQTTVAELVRRIASEYGLSAKAEDSTGRRDRWQMREDDWSFLVRRARQSATASGRGDAFLWLDEETLNFGAPLLTAPSDRRHEMAEIENRVDRIVVAYHGRAIDRAGGATLAGVGFDLNGGKSLGFTLDEAKAATHTALAKKVPRTQADGLRVVGVTEENSALVEEAVRSRWGRTAPRYFSLRVDTRPDLTLRPGMLVEVQANLDARRQTPFLGRFVVLEVQHEMTRSNIVTTASCFRREAFEGEDDPTGANAGQAGSRDSFRAGQPDVPRAVLVAEVLDE